MGGFFGWRRRRERPLLLLRKEEATLSKNERALRSLRFTRQLEVLLIRKVLKGQKRDEQTRFAETSTESIVKGSAKVVSVTRGLLAPS